MNINNILADKADIFGRSAYKWDIVPLDERFPAEVIANHSRYAHLLADSPVVVLAEQLGPVHPMSLSRTKSDAGPHLFRAHRPYMTGPDQRRPYASFPKIGGRVALRPLPFTA